MKKEIEILRVFDDSEQKVKDTVIIEQTLNIILNGEKIATLLCSPSELDYLVLGFLYSSSIIKGAEDIQKCKIEIKENKAEVTMKHCRDAACCVSTLQKQIIKGGDTEAIPEIETIPVISTEFKVHHGLIFKMMRKFEDYSVMFKETGAVHSNCLCENEDILLFSEDVARHNAVDKTVGKALVKGISFNNKYLLVSCRISKALALKISRAGIPVVASVSAVTDSAIEVCQKFGVTMIGFVRNNRMNIYTHPEKII